MTEAITSLIERLEGSEVGTKELGIEVLLHFGWHRTQVGSFYGPLYQWSAPDRKPCLISGDEDRLPNPVISLDAALALAARVIDERGPININICLAGSAQVVIDSLGPCDPVMAQVVARDPALALTIAILRVKRDRGL